MSKSRRRKKRAKKATVAETILVALICVATVAGLDWFVYDAGYHTGVKIGFNQGVEYIVDQLRSQGVEPATPQKYVPPINKGDRI